MNDRVTSMNCAVAFGLWTLSGLILVASLLVWDDHVTRHLGRLSLFTCGVAMTATIRSYFVKQNRIIRSVLAVRDSEPSDLRSVR